MAPPTSYETVLLRVMNLFDKEVPKTMESAIHDAACANNNMPPNIRLREVVYDLLAAGWLAQRNGEGITCTEKGERERSRLRHISAAQL